MNVIRTHSNDTTKPMHFKKSTSFSPIDTSIDESNWPVDYHDSIKYTMAQCPKIASTKKKARKTPSSRSLLGDKTSSFKNKAADRKVVEFHGRLARERNPKYFKVLTSANDTIRRKRGKPAGSLRTYKDVAFRRALYRSCYHYSTLRAMLPFTNKHADRTMPKIRSLGLIIDPLSEYPDREGSEFCPFRDEPLRIALCRNREELDDMIKDLNENKEKYICETNAIKIHELISGSRPLVDIMGKSYSKIGCAQEKDINKEFLADINRLQSSPECEPNSKCRPNTEMLNSDDMNQLFSE